MGKTTDFDRSFEKYAHFFSVFCVWVGKWGKVNSNRWGKWGMAIG